MPRTQRTPQNDKSAAGTTDRFLVWTLTPDGLIQHTVQGRPRIALVGEQQPWRELWPEESRSAVDRAIARAAEGEVARFRLLASRDDPDRTYWETTVTPVCAVDGSVLALSATSCNITLDVERESLLNTVVQALPSPMAVKDILAGEFILWNSAAERMLGLGADDAPHGSRGPTLDRGLREAFDDAQAEALRTGENQIRHVAPSDETSSRAFDLRTVATLDDFGPRHLITLCNDVSERHAAAAAALEAASAAAQANEAKSRFLANMSHELRTPMNGIIAGADLLRREALSPRGQELVGMIQTSGASLEQLLSGILDLASIEAGRMVIEDAPFHLGNLVRQVSAHARLAADEIGIGLAVSLDAKADGLMLGDCLRIGQVLGNLLGNAVKFTDVGAVRLSVEAAGAGVVRFCVSDTGIGFDDEARARIFDRFQQADASTTRRFGGSGLGLAISQDLIALMGGALHCESVVGEGSKFWFELTLPAQGEAYDAPPHPREIAQPAGVRVLLADDHPTNRRVVELLLAGVAEVVSVADGREAVDAFLARDFDLVLMDMQMPVMDGLSAIRQIRAIEQRGRRAPTPIIMLTANVAQEHSDASREAGADIHLGKPITAERLFLAMGEVLV